MYAVTTDVLSGPVFELKVTHSATEVVHTICWMCGNGVPYQFSGVDKRQLLLYIDLHTNYRRLGNFLLKFFIRYILCGLIFVAEHTDKN